MVWGAFGFNGTTDLAFITQRRNSKKYRGMLEDHLLEAGPNWIFQQDNAPVYASKSTKMWFKRLQSTVFVRSVDTATAPPPTLPRGKRPATAEVGRTCRNTALNGEFGQFHRGESGKDDVTKKRNYVDYSASSVVCQLDINYRPVFSFKEYSILEERKSLRAFPNCRVSSYLLRG
ncbi:uncharacterized protein LOC111637241 [Centruroides sculpturatus]|uniref:uncharacterized protein LOC111637241 n=1 Tax=Centruroides sculpturatus TaxID=218467 RepID=UPI000C6CE7C2|nr:uncharacterized protein LOC111637241 [Centruroides sculpturatus]